MAMLKIFTPIDVYVDKTPHKPKKIWFSINNGTISVGNVLGKKSLRKLVDAMDTLPEQSNGTWAIEITPVNKKSTTITIGRITDADSAKEMKDSEYWITITDKLAEAEEYLTLNMSKEDFFRVRDLIETEL